MGVQYADSRPTQWLKSHRTQGTPFPTSNFWLRAFPHLKFCKDAGER